MSDNKDTEIRSIYDDYSVEELTEELKTVFFCSPAITDKELREMEQIMSVLRQKDPLPQVYSGAELWERFREVHGEELSSLGIRNTEEVKEKETEAESATVVPVPVPVKATEAAPTPNAEAAPTPKSGLRKLLHTALIAAAVVAAMIIVTASASAMGINIWGWVMVRENGTVRFVAEDAVSKDIPAALKQAGVDVPLFPTWIPEGFLLFDQQIRLDDSVHINSTYACKDKYLLISIRAINKDFSRTIEIEDEPPKEYLFHGVVHYIVPNCEQLVTYWTNSGYLVKITGNVNIEEIEHIINSVYEEVKR